MKDIAGNGLVSGGGLDCGAILGVSLAFGAGTGTIE